MAQVPISKFTATDPLFEQSPLGILYESLDGGIKKANPAFCRLIGYTQDQLRHLDSRAISHPEDFTVELRAVQLLLRYPDTTQTLKKRLICRNGSIVSTEVILSLIGHDEEDSYIVMFITDLSQMMAIEQEIEQRQQREALLNAIASLARKTLDVSEVLETTAELLKNFLTADRVVIYQFTTTGGICIAEEVEPAYPAMQGRTFNQDCIPPAYLEAYQRGRFWVVENISIPTLTECHRKMLEQVQVRSLMVAPIQMSDRKFSSKSSPISQNALRVHPNGDFKSLWGLLAIHHCRTPRPWTLDEQQLVQAAANQLGIALEQAALMQQLQAYTHELEHRVKERTRSLEQSLKFEQLIRRLTETLHAEFDEDSVLKVAVQGLVETLSLAGCQASLYYPNLEALEVRTDYFRQESVHQHSLVGARLALESLPDEMVNNLLSGRLFIANFTSHFKGSTPVKTSQLVNPIWDEEGLIGTLCLFPKRKSSFSENEVKLIEQVAVQCAIAIRHARLVIREHASRVSAEYFRLFLEKSTDVFVEYDRQLRYLYINPIGALLLGKSEQEIIGKTNRQLIGDAAEVIEQSICQVIETGEQVFIDYELSLPTGLKTFETSYAPISDKNGLVLRVIGICRDISETRDQWEHLQEQNRQLTVVNRLKEEFIANTSHELRTPLTAVLGFSSVLLTESFGTLTPKQREYIERINSSGQHLLELINDILDLSRIEADRLELDPQLIFISDVCQNVINLLQERALNQGINIELEIDPNLDYMVADPKRLRQMLLNLLTNAVKFTLHGKVGLKVYTSSLEHSLTPTTNFIHFLVWDTGIGINESDQSLLFYPFSQIDNSLSRKHSGTGLGLVITRKLAELQGGSVTVESHPGEGSRFTLHLPFYTSQDAIDRLYSP